MTRPHKERAIGPKRATGHAARGISPRPASERPLAVYDVIVVGAGVAGALVAWRLSQCAAAKRPRILLLEAGEQGPERVELVGHFARAFPKTPHSPFISPKNDQFAPSPDSERDYDQLPVTPTRKDALKSGYERRVGGSTWHWLGHAPRLLPSDFLMKTRYGVGEDWPLSYRELEPWYGEAERALGVGGAGVDWDGILGAFRSTEFPMELIWPSYSDLRVAALLQRAGARVDDVPLVPLSTPSARNTEAYDGRPACAGNSSCVPICPIGAKYDASVHVAKARAAGVEVREKSAAVFLSLDPSGRVAHVRVKTWDGGESAIRGGLVVLAGNAIETPRLLLLSAQEGAEAGVANRSGQVGRNLMDHLQKAALAITDEPLYPFRGPPSTSGIDALRDGPFRRTRSAYRISLGNDGWSRSGSPYSDLWDAVSGAATGAPLLGEPLRAYLRERLTHQFRLSCSTEVLPRPDNRVTLSTQVDGLGLRRVAVQFSADSYTKDGLRAATDTMVAIFDAVGTRERRIDTDFDTYSGAGHLMGTARMGVDPRASVVDADVRAHDHSNLFIVGGATFPTAGTANPTLTIAALALRAANAIAKQLHQ